MDRMVLKGKHEVRMGTGKRLAAAGKGGAKVSRKWAVFGLESG